jgi:putative colanic acid biosynthesis glycosyltransferase
METDTMRILQINTVYGTGSTGRIMAGLYSISADNGYEPYAAFARSEVPEGIKGYHIGSRSDFLCHVAKDILFDGSGFGSKWETQKFLKCVDEIKPDIIHLHNIHGFYLQIEELFDYIKKNNIPVIWTFHDCWPVTGHCAYFDYIGCDRWKTGCYRCPQHLQSYPYSISDNSRENYDRKRKAFTGVQNLTIVTPSKWLADIVKQSYLKKYPVRVIPNGIDTAVFRVISGKVEGTHNDDGIRSDNIKGQKNVNAHISIGNCYMILGVANVWTKRKGIEYFEQIADMIDDSFIICLVGVNEHQKKMLERRHKGRIIGIQHTESQKELVKLYNRALCFVNPTLEDNFPTTNLESLACGTPVITFRTGGSPESIDETCGYVVDKGDIEQVYEKIGEIVKRGKEWYTERCRKRALEYSRDKRFNEYMQLYSKVSDARYHKSV